MHTKTQSNVNSETMRWDRYVRQVAFEPFGFSGQKALLGGRALLVGVGGLGSWVAELLARAGVGFLRLVDDDYVDLTNIHRQALYAQQDADRGRHKVEAAAHRLQHINDACLIETATKRLDRFNIDCFAQDVDVVIDGLDNFAACFIINDYCVKKGLPWIFAGVVRTEAQTATIIPGQTPCLRCLLEDPPLPCTELNCRHVGVFGMAVAAIAAFQAMEAVKIMSGRHEDVSPYVLKFDMWANTLNRLHFNNSGKQPSCPCCDLQEFEYLEP